MKNMHQNPKIFKNNKKYENKTFNFDYVECAICGLYGKKLQFHIQMIHRMTIKEYKKIYNRSIVSEKLLIEQSNRIKGEKNPAFNHGGRFSVFSNNFIGSTLKEEAIRKIKETKKTKPQNVNTNVLFYASRGYSEEEAKKKLNKRQLTFSLEKCIEKYGEELGHKKWTERQKKWQTTLQSKSKEEISEINRKKLSRIGRISKAEKFICESLINNGLRIKQQQPIKTENQNWFRYDVMFNNRIIEYNGNYWHANPKIYNENCIFKRNNKIVYAKDIWERDEKKTKTAIENGYEVLIIWEDEFLKDKQKVIEKCINFLTQ